MFTGIVQAVGEVHSVEKIEQGHRFTIDPLTWAHQPKPGDSIANDGCCLTIAQIVDGRWAFDAIPETLAKTTLGGWKPGGQVNLEHALRIGDTLDGHQVQGHIDGTGTVIAVETADGYRVRIQLDPGMMQWMIPKGSVAIDGISLTIAALDTNDHWIEVAIIPETLDRTTLGDKAVGDPLNIEADAMVKTIVQTIQSMQSTTQIV
jgi:riboflavin synthase